MSKPVKLLPMGQAGDRLFADAMLHVAVPPAMVDGVPAPAVLKLNRAALDPDRAWRHPDLVGRRLPDRGGRRGRREPDHLGLEALVSPRSELQAWAQTRLDRFGPGQLAAHFSRGLLVLNSGLDDVEMDDWVDSGPRQLRSIDWPALNVADEADKDSARVDRLDGRVASAYPIEGTRDHGATVLVKVRTGVAAVIEGRGPILDSAGAAIESLQGWSVYRVCQNDTMLVRAGRSSISATGTPSADRCHGLRAGPWHGGGQLPDSNLGFLAARCRCDRTIDPAFATGSGLGRSVQGMILP